VDSGVVIFSDVPIHYDPLIAKLIVWGRDRQEAISRTKRALEEYRVSGLKTTIGFCRVVMDNKAFIEGRLSTKFLQEQYPDNQFEPLSDTIIEQAALAAAVDKFIKERKVAFDRGGPRTTQTGWVSYYRRGNLRQFGGSR
jgi:propionyl-CoA carboxylase alpha chain